MGAYTNDSASLQEIIASAASRRNPYVPVQEEVIHTYGERKRSGSSALGISMLILRSVLKIKEKPAALSAGAAAIQTAMQNYMACLDGFALPVCRQLILIYPQLICTAD